MGAFKGTHAHGRALLMYRKMKKGRRDLNKIRPSVDNTKRSRPTARSRTNTHVLLSPTYLGILIAVDGDGGVNLGSEECSQLAQEQDEHAKPDRKKGAESTTGSKKHTGAGVTQSGAGFFQEQAVSVTEIWVSVPLLSGDATEGVRGARYKECARHTGEGCTPNTAQKVVVIEREPQRQQQNRTSLLLCF